MVVPSDAHILQLDPFRPSPDLLQVIDNTVPLGNLKATLTAKCQIRHTRHIGKQSCRFCLTVAIPMLDRIVTNRHHHKLCETYISTVTQELSLHTGSILHRGLIAQP